MFRVFWDREFIDHCLSVAEFGSCKRAQGSARLYKSESRDLRLADFRSESCRHSEGLGSGPQGEIRLYMPNLSPLESLEASRTNPTAVTCISVQKPTHLNCKITQLFSRPAVA